MAWGKTLLTRPLRRLWLDIHLYLGLSLGALLVVFGLTGSILVFYEEIDEWLNPGLRTVSVIPAKGTIPKPLHQIVAAGNQFVPRDHQLKFILYPRTENSTFDLSYSDAIGVWVGVFIDPYTARVVWTHRYDSEHPGIPNPFDSETLIDFIAKLHYNLLLGHWGGIFVGIVAIFLLFSLMTGLVLWWPSAKRWQQAFVIKRNASGERFNFDLHRTFGFYWLPVLGAVLLSGVWLNLNEQFVWVVEQFSPPALPKEFKSTNVKGKPPLTAQQAVERVLQEFPEGKLHWVQVPDNPDAVYVVDQIDVPALSQFWSERKISLDQYSGQILHVEAANTRRNAGETFLAWQWPLHSGKAFGMTGRILVLVCGLVCPLLFVTGLLRWMQKRRSARFSEKRRSKIKAQSV